MRNLIISWFGLFSFVFVSACSSGNQDLEIIENMMSQPIMLQFNEFNDYYSISNKTKEDCKSSKIVVYVDSTLCSTCVMSSFNRWNSFIDSISSRYDVDFIFIVNPQHRKLNQTVMATKYNTLNCPIYIDSTHVFMNKNPHLPKETQYHTFLLNAKDSVMVVGDPLININIYNLTIKKLNQISKIK